MALILKKISIVFILVAIFFGGVGIIYKIQNKQILNVVQADDDDKPKTTVSTSVRTILIPDTDGDGLVDSKDPHPKIQEIYIVEDENNNGIVDTFEE